MYQQDLNINPRSPGLFDENDDNVFLDTDSKSPTGPIMISTPTETDKDVNATFGQALSNKNGFMDTNKPMQTQNNQQIFHISSGNVRQNPYLQKKSQSNEKPGSKLYIQNGGTLKVNNNGGTLKGNKNDASRFENSISNRSFNNTNELSTNFQRSQVYSKRFTSNRHYVDKSKASSITFFDLETDNLNSYRYRPGEEITGRIRLVVKESVEIRYVELDVIGEGKITIRRQKNGSPITTKEMYLHKRKCVIGTPDADQTCLLTPGEYVSKFRVKLPRELPSSSKPGDGFQPLSVDINYTMTARVCDNLKRVPAKKIKGNLSAYVTVLLSKKVPFRIEREFDLARIPESTAQVYHHEDRYLSCTHSAPVSVTLTLDRSVFLAGDDIRIQTVIHLPSPQTVKEISCSLEQNITFDPKHDPVTMTLSKVMRQNLETGTGADGVVTCDYTIPTSVNLLSPYSLGETQLKLAYFVCVFITFSQSGGSFEFKVPVGVGPCAEPIYAEKISARKLVPLFNRPKRFPCFTSATPTETLTSRSQSVRSLSSVQVKSKYRNSVWSKLILCMCGVCR